MLLARAKDVHHRYKPTEYKSASSLGIKKFSTTLVVMEKLKIAVIGKYLILTRNKEVGINYTSFGHQVKEICNILI